jgi:hypothetical protein
MVLSQKSNNSTTGHTTQVSNIIAAAIRDAWVRTKGLYHFPDAAYGNDRESEARYSPGGMHGVQGDAREIYELGPERDFKDSDLHSKIKVAPYPMANKVAGSGAVRVK